MLRFSAFLLPAALLSLPTAALAQTPPSAPSKSITLTVINGNLHAVAATLERAGGIRCLVQDGKIPYHPLNVSLTDVPLPVVLRMIAFSAGAQVAQNAKGVYVFTLIDTAIQPAPFPVPPRQDPYDHSLLPWKITFIQRTSASLDLIDRE